MSRSIFVAVLTMLVATAAIAQSDGRERLRQDLRRAEELERAGRLADAEDLLRGVLDTWPTEAGPLLALERVLRGRGELDRFLPALERALSVEPTSGALRQMQMRTLAQLGRLDELREAGGDWLEVSPRSEMAYRDYAAQLRQVGDVVEAERVLRAGLAFVGRPSIIAVELADLYLSQERWEEAAEQWVGILRASAGAGWDLVHYKLEGLGEDAKPAAEAALRVLAGEGSPGAAKLAALAALFAERPEEAREHAERIIGSGGPSSERRAFMMQFARAAADRGQEEVAGWAYRYLLSAGGNAASGLDLSRRIIDHELALGDTAAALEAAERAMAESDEGSATHRWAASTRIRLLAATMDTDGAEREYRRFAGRYANDAQIPELAILVGEANLRTGDFDEARRLVEGASRTNVEPAFAARLATLSAYLDLYDGEYEAARSKLEGAATALDGERRNRAIRLLRFLRDGSGRELKAVAEAHREFIRGRTEQASRRLLRGLERAPASGARPALLLWAGELALAAGDRREGQKVLRRLAEEHPASGEATVALMTLAETLAEQGRRDEAMVMLEKLILEYPGSALTPIARRRLAELREEVPRS